MLINLITCNVQSLWRVTIRGLSVTTDNRKPFIWHVAMRDCFCSEKEVVAAVRLRFTSSWWSEHIIIEIEQIGGLQFFDGTALYE